MDKSYEAVMARKNNIMKSSVGIDYSEFERGGIVFDYEELMSKTAPGISEIAEIQKEAGVGGTPLVELKNISSLVRSHARKGYGARIFVKDEAASLSGSFKDRRASLSMYVAKESGFEGVIAATSGNYGAAVASQAARRGLKCIVLQETFDSKGMGQPEILEKGRACESYGAEVIQLSVGPELFYYLLRLLEETGFFNASLYTPYGIAGVETLGAEIVSQCREQLGRDPDHVVVTHAGGGNLTGTSRGLQKAGADRCKIIAASVELTGLHMASDNDFNRKSFTTGHTGFGVPFAVAPDRSDVPRNAARPLRYMDKYVLVTQGEVFFATEIMARLEGMQRGPAGSTSIAAAIALARELPEDEVMVVQETEYTGAGKSPSAQLTFAKNQGIEVMRGDPQKLDKPGERIVIPENFSQFSYTEIPMNRLRTSYLKRLLRDGKESFTDEEMHFICDELNADSRTIERIIEEELCDGQSTKR